MRLGLYCSPLAAAAALASVMFTAGCASRPPPAPVKVVVMPAPVVLKPARVGVAWVRLNPYTVVVREDSYRHVLTDQPRKTAAAGRGQKAPCQSANKPPPSHAAGKAAAPLPRSAADPAVNPAVAPQTATRPADVAA